MFMTSWGSGGLLLAPSPSGFSREREEALFVLWLWSHTGLLWFICMAFICTQALSNRIPGSRALGLGTWEFAPLPLSVSHFSIYGGRRSLSSVFWALCSTQGRCPTQASQVLWLRETWRTWVTGFQSLRCAGGVLFREEATLFLSPEALLDPAYQPVHLLGIRQAPMTKG